MRSPVKQVLYSLERLILMNANIKENIVISKVLQWKYENLCDFLSSVEMIEIQ